MRKIRTSRRSVFVVVNIVAIIGLGIVVHYFGMFSAQFFAFLILVYLLPLVIIPTFFAVGGTERDEGKDG